MTPGILWVRIVPDPGRTRAGRRRDSFDWVVLVAARRPSPAAQDVVGLTGRDPFGSVPQRCSGAPTDRGRPS